MYTLMDELQILVCKTSSLSQDSGLSGLTFNHPLLGSVVLVNNNTTLGRQIFTFTHELYHVIFICF